jgi:hypothetical protein
MSDSASAIELSDEQKKNICIVVANGCDRETAAKFARTTWAAIHAAMNADHKFAADVRFEEAVVELNHMVSVHKAAKKEANWRASVWWLEAMHPERYGPRGSGQVTSKQLKLYVEHIATTLVVEVHNDEDRERLLSKLHETATTLEQLLRDEFVPERSVTAASLLAERDDVPTLQQPPTMADETSIADEETA